MRRVRFVSVRAGRAREPSHTSVAISAYRVGHRTCMRLFSILQSFCARTLRRAGKFLTNVFGRKAEMTGIDRRTFLQRLAGAGAFAALPESIKRALAIEPNVVTGTIQDVQHIVILMQENRSFDHYFGTLRGVRGFSDPRAVRLYGTGNSVFEQPNQNSAGVTQIPGDAVPLPSGGEGPRIGVHRRPAARLEGCTPMLEQRALRSCGPGPRAARIRWLTSSAAIFRTTTRWRMPSRSAMPISRRG